MKPSLEARQKCEGRLLVQSVARLRFNDSWSICDLVNAVRFT